MKKLMIVALFALPFTTAFTCSKQTPEAPPPAEMPAPPQEQMGAPADGAAAPAAPAEGAAPATPPPADH